MVRILLSVGLWLVGLLQPAVAAPAGPPRPGETFTVEKLDLVMIWIEPGTFSCVAPTTWATARRWC